MLRSAAERSDNRVCRLSSGIEADDAVECVIAVVRVKGRDAQVTRLCVGDRGRHRLLVADFADQDAVRGLSQCVPQRDLEADRVRADLALVDDGLLVAEHVFDRILEREDVAGPLRVAQVEHRCDGGRLARAGRTDDQDESALLHDDLAHHRRQVERVDRRDVAGDVANDDGDRTTLLEGGQPETSDAADAEAAVEFMGGRQFVEVGGRDDLGQQTLDHRVVHQLLIDGDRRAIDLHVDRRPDRDEKVGRLLLGHQLEQTFHCHGESFAG